jgi:hypothetical protein
MKPDEECAFTFCNPEDAHNFTVTKAVRLHPFSVPTRWERMREATRRVLPWFFPRVVVSDIDTAAGAVTLTRERWSWRRWKWERR